MRLPRPIAIDLLEVFRTGRFDCLKIGQTREHILHNFPDPDDWSSDAASRRRAAIWRYGNIELHFDRSELCLIFSDYIDTLHGGPSLAIDPWILAQPDQLTLLDVMRALNRERIDFTKSTHVFSQESVVFVNLRLSSGVTLQFDATSGDDADAPQKAIDIDHNELRLGSFSLQG